MNSIVTMDKTIAEYRQKFYTLYNSTIKPLFGHYEKERKAIFKKTVIISGICGVIFFLLFLDWLLVAPGAKRSDFVNFLGFALMIASLCATIAVPIYYNDKFVTKLKNSCMDSILNLFGDMHWYKETEVISDEELNASGLFAAYNRREVDDGFTGVFKNVPFAISETGMTMVSGSGKNRREVRIFKGVVIKFKANKEIRNKTIVATKGDTKLKGNIGISFWLVSSIILFNLITSLFTRGFDFSTVVVFLIAGILVFGILGIVKIVSKVSQKEVLNEIKLEDPEFSKKYKAYSSDQIEGRYLITPAFMERFKNIQTSFGTDNVKCSFYGDSLMFAISTNKNLFELGSLYSSLDNPKQLEVFFNELSSVFLLVEYFKLNEETGL